MKCELCERAARMYCESDQASLCWECDAKVHGANFLVARHSRCLLCRNCQAPTPWRASGARLGPTVSVCERCCLQGKHWREDVGDDDGISQEAEVDEGDDLMEEDEGEEEVEGEGEGEGDAEDDDNEEEEEEEDGDNQVVPRSLTPPAVASSSSSEESSSRIYNGYLKRVWENADLASRDVVLPCSSSQPTDLALAPARTIGEDEATSLRPSKDHKKTAVPRPAPLAHAAPSPAKSQPVKANCTSTGSSAAAILDIRHRRDPRTVHLAPSNSPSPPI